MSKPNKVINNPVFLRCAVYGYADLGKVVKLSRVEGVHAKGTEFTIETLNTLYEVRFSSDQYREAFVEQLKDKGYL